MADHLYIFIFLDSGSGTQKQAVNQILTHKYDDVTDLLTLTLRSEFKVKVDSDVYKLIKVSSVARTDIFVTDQWPVPTSVTDQWPVLTSATDQCPVLTSLTLSSSFQILESQPVEHQDPAVQLHNLICSLVLTHLISRDQSLSSATDPWPHRLVVRLLDRHGLFSVCPPSTVIAWLRQLQDKIPPDQVTNYKNGN